MIKKIIIIMLLFVVNKSAFAQYRTDSEYIEPTLEKEEGQKNFTRSIPFQMLTVGGFLITGSVVLFNESKHFKYLRNGYLPKFHYTYDDYSQYAPAAAIVIMKAAGVKSRSSWSRMLVSDAFTVAIMSGTVNLMKYSLNVQRPDGSGYNSYPSGHTATAFMTATMFSKEYGPRSRWYSFGAYALATLTGYTRFLNNKHWTADGLCGAGIGIISTELGYYFADLIFKDKGLNLPPLIEEYSRYHKPSFLGIVLGVNKILGKYHTPNNDEIRFDSGADLSLEGAWFLNKNWGIGGQLTAVNTTVKVNGKDLLYSLDEHKDFPNDKEKSIDVFSIKAGGYYSYPLTSRWLIGSKLLAGISYTPPFKLYPIIEGRRSVFSITTGFNITYKCKQHLALKFFTDYHLQQSAIVSKEKMMNMLGIGGAISILL